ncbi:sensor histidine kinase [Cohnella sp. GCM10020058]|uniref:cache domain-containing sensor histidine kinase n=1 Tax=Cohnella sp. GCM10020058 TaxID=3317330 RepID=UPI00362E4536
MKKTQGLQFKLSLTFILILIPLVVVSLFANNYSQRIMNEQIRERTKGALQTTLAYMDQMASNMDQQTLLISSNPSIVNIWRDKRDPFTPDNLYDVHTVQQQLNSLTNINGSIKEAYILHGESGNGVSTTLGGIRWPRVKEEAWFQQAVHGVGALLLYVPGSGSGEGTNRYLQDDSLYYIRLLDVLSESPEPNVLIFAVRKSALQDIIQHLQTSADMNITLFYGDKPILETNPEAERARGQDLFTIRESGGAWSIQLEQPKAEIFKLSHRLQLFTYLTILLSILLAMWIAWLVYIQILRPLYQLSGAFKLVKNGNLTHQIKHDRRDELGHVMDGFNQMAAAQRIMIEENYEKELRIAKSEFNLLQSQINPHFLYNTLDSIYSVAVKHGMREISDMVLNLAKFFRVSLGKGRQDFTLAETAEHLMYYIRVQQMRTAHFTADIELAEDTKDIPMLKLLLQPIVENAIIHGIEKDAMDGELRIRSGLDRRGLIVEVADTGAGMPPSRLEEIRRELGAITSKLYRLPQDSPSSRFFGLKNVKSRLKLYYGEAADLLVESEEYVGTKVTLIIPIRTEERA